MLDRLSVNLDGIPTEIKRLKIDLKHLILDIENPRIQYFLDTRKTGRLVQEYDIQTSRREINP